MRAIVTAGATREAVDEVRFVSNAATGGLPAAMAEALLARGAVVHYLHGPGAALPGRREIDLVAGDEAGFEGRLSGLAAEARRARRDLACGQLVLEPVTSAAEARDRLQDLCRGLRPELVACAMAVADYAPGPVRGKISSALPGLSLDLLPTPKVIDVVRAASPGTRLLGFKLLVGADLAAFATAARHLADRSGADWIFANDLADHRQGLRRGWLLGREGEVLASLDGGAGQAGTRLLGERLIEALAGRMAAGALPPDRPRDAGDPGEGPARGRRL